MSKASLSLLDLAGVKPYQPKKDEEYMNEDQILHFRKILTAWHEQIVEEASRTVAHMQDEASNFPDPADRATQEEEFSLELRNRDRERKLMKKIEYTLKKLDTDDFGYCDSCGEEIGIRRLEARPTVIFVSIAKPWLKFVKNKPQVNLFKSSNKKVRSKTTALFVFLSNVHLTQRME